MDAYRHLLCASRRNLRSVLSILAALLLLAAIGSPAPAAASPLALSTTLTQISAGYQHTCAVKSDGSITCWGNNDYGQATLPTPNSGFTQVSAGHLQTCALKTDGSLACWGYNSDGQATPPTPNSDFTQVSAGGWHTCALKTDGSLACWGDNIFGQSPPPTPNSGFTQVSDSRIHTCALKSDGSLACWGRNEYGQITLPSPNSSFTQVSAGHLYTCALKSDGSLACWGDNSYGQATPPTPNSGFTQISAGLYHACALKNDGSLACWGDNSYGQATPPSPNSGFTQVDAGWQHTCAIKDGQAGLCWGFNEYGQAPVISLSPALPASVPYGDSYTQALTAANGLGGAPYAFAVAAGTLPPGLALSSSGTLSGTPTQAGSFSFTLRALDAIGYMGTREYTLEVARAPLTARADDLSRAYGRLNPPLTYSFNGFKNYDGPGVVSGTQPTLETDALPASPPGDYPIRIIPGSLAADNYTITYAPGTLRVLNALFLPAVQR